MATQEEKILRKLRLDKLSKNPKISRVQQSKPKQRPKPMKEMNSKKVKIDKRSSRDQLQSSNDFMSVLNNANVGLRENSDEDDPFRIVWNQFLFRFLKWFLKLILHQFFYKIIIINEINFCVKISFNSCNTACASLFQSNWPGFITLFQVCFPFIMETGLIKHVLNVKNHKVCSGNLRKPRFCKVQHRMNPGSGATPLQQSKTDYPGNWNH